MAKNDFALANNPLVNPPSLPHGAPAFGQIKAEHFLPALEWAIEEFEDAVEKIKSNPDAPTFENTVLALMNGAEDIKRVQLYMENFSLSYKTAELKAVESDFNSKGKAYLDETVFGNVITLDEELFARVKEVYDNREAFSLNAEDNMLLDHIFKTFERGGANLESEADKKRIKEIDTKMAELTTKFADNTLDSSGAFQMVFDDASELEGVPERVMDMYANAAKQAGMEGKFLATYSTVVPIMSYAVDATLRGNVQAQLGKIATQEPNDNRPILMEIVKLRHERAQLLGYENHAEFILSDRMAKTPETVQKFLETNKNAYYAKAKAEHEAIAAFALQRDGITDIKSSDLSYYERLLEEETFDFDSEKVREYFELGNVLQGLFDHAEKLFGVKMVEANDKYPVQNEDVTAYEVFDKDSGELKGIFYADMYAREGEKKGGAWMSLFRDRGTYSDGENKVPIVMNNLNIPKPAEGKPTLLSIDEVETIFHEFGHGLHGLLAEGQRYFLTGPNVKWDFVELPSQLQEQWATEDEVLQTYAHHYETGDVIPSEFIQKLKDKATFSSGDTGMRQTRLAMFDMAWHTTDPADITSVEDLEGEIIAQTSFVEWSGNTMSQRFGHLFNDFVGYSSGYYSYKWAEVLDADVFEAFKEHGLYDEELSARLKDTIYSKGGTVAPDELYRQMMDRDPDAGALFRREGVDVPQDTAPPQEQVRAKPGKLKPS